MEAPFNNEALLLGVLDSCMAERAGAEQEYMWQVVEGRVALLALEEVTVRKELAQQMRHEQRLLELLAVVPSPSERSLTPVLPGAQPSLQPRRSGASANTVSAKEIEALWSVEKAAMQRKINELRSRIATIELSSVPSQPKF